MRAKRRPRGNRWRRKTAARAFAKGLANQLRGFLFLDGRWSKSNCKPGENLSGSECEARDRQKDTRAENEIRVPGPSGLSDTYPSRSETAIKSQFQAA